MTLISEPAGRRAPAPAGTDGARHRAPESDAEIRIAAPGDLSRPGRHAEPEWVRELFDPRVDGDPLDWLGFDPRTA